MYKRDNYSINLQVTKGDYELFEVIMNCLMYHLIKLQLREL